MDGFRRQLLARVWVVRLLACYMCATGLLQAGRAQQPAVLTEPDPTSTLTGSAREGPSLTRSEGPPLSLARSASEGPAITRTEAPSLARLARPVATDELKRVLYDQHQSLPIDLDTVLQLTSQRNAKINLARERVRQYCDAKAIHSLCCSKQAKAQGECLQKRLELSNSAAEILREAGNTYFDLLAARTLEADLRDMEKFRSELLDRARRQTRTEPGTTVQVKSLEAATSGLSQVLERLQQQGDAAAAKLAYLIGEDGCTDLAPIEARIRPVDLVPADTALCALLDQALTTGPGIQESQELVAFAQSQVDQAGKLCRCSTGHGCGTGCGWCLNLAAVCTGPEQRRLAQSHLNQSLFNYQDVRGKLTASVRDAYTAIHSGRQQISLLDTQARQADEAYNLSNTRLLNNAPGSSIQEVALAIDTLGAARRNHVEAIANYNKAQVQLLISLGLTTAP